ncbi:MAG: hypothetical protein ACKOPS_07745 [Cyanobium sp.]
MSMQVYFSSLGGLLEGDGVGFAVRKAGGIYLNDSGRRLWLQAWSAFMAEPIQLAKAGSGPRWEVLDQLVKSFAAAVDDSDRPLDVPLRR